LYYYYYYYHYYHSSSRMFHFCLISIFFWSYPKFGWLPKKVFSGETTNRVKALESYNTKPSMIGKSAQSVTWPWPCPFFWIIHRELNATWHDQSGYQIWTAYLHLCKNIDTSQNLTRSSAIVERPVRRSVLVKMLFYCCTNNANKSPVSPRNTFSNCHGLVLYTYRSTIAQRAWDAVPVYNLVDVSYWTVTA